mgnify:CR=1 FL=1
MHYIGLYIEFIKLKIMGVAEYRKSFLLGALAQAAAYGAEFLLIWVLVDKFQSVHGWGSYEVMFLYALNLASYALAGFFLFTPCTQLSFMIKNGSFDEILTRPLNSFLYLISKEFNSAYISHLLLSIFIIFLCFHQLGIALTFVKWMGLLVCLLGGALIQGAGFVATSVPAFWFVETQGLRNIFFFQLRNFIRYPVSAYNKFVQIVLTLLLPYAFINFYPSQFFLEKSDFMMFSPSFQYGCPFVGLLLFGLSYWFWNVGINHYKSTGS